SRTNRNSVPNPSVSYASPPHPPPPSPFPSLTATLFFYRSRDHRDLHSFPTRRSSDLLVARPAAGGLGMVGEIAHVRVGLLESFRSEEHTSELQSRGHLVCRLLLEKKKARHVVVLAAGAVSGHDTGEVMTGACVVGGGV